MKKLLLLIAITLSFATLEAQENANQNETTVKKSCSKDCTKSCCANKSKSCEKSKKSCSKTCTGTQAAYAKNVSAKDFVAFAKKFPAEQIIDTRSAKDVDATGMIKDAVNIDYNSPDFKEKILNLDKDAAIMIYSQSGEKSKEIVEILKNWGFKKIYNLEGGYLAYKKAFPKK